MGVGRQSTYDIKHDGWFSEFKALWGDRKIEDCSQVDIELRKGAGFDGVMTRIMNSACHFAKQERIIR